MGKEYYRPKWKVQQPFISGDLLKKNRNLRNFLRIRKTIFIFNIVASASFLAVILAGVL